MSEGKSDFEVGRKTIKELVGLGLDFLPTVIAEAIWPVWERLGWGWRSGEASLGNSREK